MRQEAGDGEELERARSDLRDSIENAKKIVDQTRSLLEQVGSQARLGDEQRVS